MIRDILSTQSCWQSPSWCLSYRNLVLGTVLQT